MIPKMTPTMFSALAVLDASSAAALSPLALAFFTLLEKMMATAPIGKQQHKVVKMDHE